MAYGDVVRHMLLSFHIYHPQNYSVRLNHILAPSLADPLNTIFSWIVFCLLKYIQEYGYDKVEDFEEDCGREYLDNEILKIIVLDYIYSKAVYK